MGPGGAARQEAGDWGTHLLWQAQLWAVGPLVLGDMARKEPPQVIDSVPSVATLPCACTAEPSGPPSPRVQPMGG